MARSLKGIFNKDALAMSLGGATSGTISGFINPIIQPIIGAFPIAGLSEILIGVGGQYFFKGKGLINSYFKGVMIAGIANAISGFIPTIAGTFPSGKKLSQLATQGQEAHQVDGAAHSWPELSLYVHRNPVGAQGNVTETSIAPAGTSHLKGRQPSIALTH